MRPLVLDTNVVLDLLVFGDPRTRVLEAALDAREVRWIATAQMRDELLHVLAYPNFVKRSASADAVLAQFDARTEIVEAAPRAGVTCRDGDDQKFIDLAVVHSALLLSKDKEVLRLKKKLLLLQVIACPVYPQAAGQSAQT